MKRIQSASSINTFKQCPRKYYYRYVAGLPDEPSIHTVRGNIVHSALEHFFKLDPTSITDHETELPLKIDALMDQFWIQSKDKLKQLKLPVETLNEYYVDSRYMLGRWIQKYLKQVKSTGLPFIDAFKKLKPDVEEKLVAESIGVQGYIDALYDREDGIKIIDYKTSRKDIITPEYYLQAGIYAVLVQEVKGFPPQVISFDFLKGDTVDVPVDDELITTTLKEISFIHERTESDDIREYTKKPSGLCKWSNERGSGKCPFYDICKPFEK